jgi:VanZ family protein
MKPTLPLSTHALLHDPSVRKAWKLLCCVFAVVVGIAALSPGALAVTVTASDKIDHVLGFAALSATGLLACAPQWRRAVLVGASMLAYGALIELLQTQVPGRSGELADVVADAIGIAFGVAVVSSLRRIFREDKR